jgi:hypothetical protein
MITQRSSRAMSCAARALETTAYFSRYLAADRATLTSKNINSRSRGQSTALWPFVRYDTRKKSGAHSVGERGKEEWHQLIELYSKRTYVHVNPSPNKRRNLQPPPPVFRAVPSHDTGGFKRNFRASYLLSPIDGSSS